MSVKKLNGKRAMNLFELDVDLKIRRFGPEFTMSLEDVDILVYNMNKQTLDFLEDIEFLTEPMVRILSFAAAGLRKEDSIEDVKGVLQTILRAAAYLSVMQENEEGTSLVELEFNPNYHNYSFPIVGADFDTALKTYIQSIPEERYDIIRVMDGHRLLQVKADKICLFKPVFFRNMS